MNKRRALFGSTALVAVGAIAACAQIEKITGTTTPQAAVQAVFNACQFVLPLVDALALGISVAVPAAAPAMGAVIAGISTAGPIFQTFETTMTQAQAQPIVQQIESYVTAGVNSIAGVVNSAATGSKLAAYQSRVAQAQAVVGLLTTFVNGVSAMPTGATVPLPLLHA